MGKPSFYQDQKRRDQDEGGFSICNIRNVRICHVYPCRYILIEIQVAMMIFVCEAAPLHICQKRCKEGQIFLSSLWIRDGIHGT